MSTLDRFLAVVPAAGTGTRVGGPLPKQYLPLAGRTVIEWSLRALLEARWIDEVVVVVAAADELAGAALEQLASRFPGRLRLVPNGGASRRDSVLGGLRELAGRARAQDWVLVHDAARPGLRSAGLERLRATLAGDPVGGLLALPVADTIKRADAGGRVARTEPREGLWQAQTPQMFRFGVIHHALLEHPEVTDEAAAMEAAGFAPLLVDGDRDNFKVTTAEDLRMMQLLMQARANQAEPQR
jgi:2-C-methyl-D-erythritol 4-phosphate cytidylyltransferase